jgi:hypothetical protein
MGVGVCSANTKPTDNGMDSVVPRNEAFPKLPIGMNLSSISDWQPGFPFRNLFMGSRPWITRNTDYSQPYNPKTHDAFEYDADGYPLQVPIVAPGVKAPQDVLTYLPNRLKPGVYILLYDGEGEVDATFGATKVLSRKPGRLKLQMLHDGKQLETILIRKSKRGNHVRNIRVVAEADENVDLNLFPFTQEFLDFCRPFHCLRFMDWGQTNNSIEENWKDRKRPTFYTQAGMGGDPDALYGPPLTPFQLRFAGGVAFEFMIKLCNELKIDPWFCIPHRATDDYISQFAEFVKANLDPDLKVYVEYSNEVWNWGFAQAGWMIRSKLAGDLVEAKGGKAWTDADKKKGGFHPERIGALFRRAFGIWEQIWSGKDRDRLVRVCSVQGMWFDASKRTVKWCADHGGADAVSPAAYVGPDKDIYARWAAAGANLTPEQVTADLMLGKEIVREDNAPARIVRYARSFGMRFVAYEGGQHIQPQGQVDQPYSPALTAVQYHPKMYDLYVELLRFQRDLGCELFCHYSSTGNQGTRHGSWGAKVSYSESNDISPKMRALIACNIAKTPIS